MIKLCSGAIAISKKEKSPYTKFQCGSYTHEVYYNMLKNKVTSVFKYFKVFLQNFCGLVCNCINVATMRERKCQSFMESC